ncbi:MAG: ABC transporter permease subunit, partial [Clostridia bacterium]|nr:ABC transporter permease subunit [Clostridia bacterium]
MDLSPLYISLKVATISTTIVFCLGIVCARFVMKLKKGKIFVDGIFTLPIVLPPTVVGFFLLIIFGKNGLIGQILSTFDVSVVFTQTAAVIASIFVSFPLMYRTVRGAFEELDADIIYAARTLGMSEIEIFYKVILPNTLPSIIAGTVLS